MSLCIDVMIITGYDHDGIQSLKHDLVYRLSVKDLFLLCYFLGIEVVQSLNGYLLSHTKYISDLFERAWLSDNQTINTSLKSKTKYSPTNSFPLLDPRLYLTIGGILVYLTVTRQDIPHAVRVAC